MVIMEIPSHRKVRLTCELEDKDTRYLMNPTSASALSTELEDEDTRHLMNPTSTSLSSTTSFKQYLTHIKLESNCPEVIV